MEICIKISCRLTVDWITIESTKLSPCMILEQTTGNRIVLSLVNMGFYSQTALVVRDFLPINFSTLYRISAVQWASAISSIKWGYLPVWQIGSWELPSEILKEPVGFAKGTLSVLYKLEQGSLILPPLTIGPGLILMYLRGIFTALQIRDLLPIKN